MRIAGNLDVEVTWARMDAAARRAGGEKAPSPDDPRFALPEPVMRKISAAATLMRVFAQSDDDVLWTPRPVDPSRMARVEWLPTPRLESGPVPETADVWWGEATEVAALVNHRSFVHDVRTSTKCALVGEAIVRDIDDLRARAGRMGEWVAKAPLSAAGRLRVRGFGTDWTPAIESQARRLLGVYGCLLLEPWLDRRADFGVTGSMESEGWSNSHAHRLIVDGAGRFQAIRVSDDEAPETERAMQRTVMDFGEALQARGHRGPFGFDFFETVVNGDAAPRIHLSEINARRTFGHVAMNLAGRCELACDFRLASTTLRFGRGEPPDATISLLLPGADDDTSAWLEAPPRHAG